MSRRIVTSGLQSAGGGPVDGYLSRLVKFIPADVVAAWVAADQMIQAASDEPSPALQWTVFGFGLVLSVLWTIRVTRMPGERPAIVQALVAGLAFVIWVFGIGGPFALLPFYTSLVGGLAILGGTLILGLIIPPESN